MTPYELQISGGVVKLEWGTWAMHRFCELNGGIAISKLMQLYQGETFSFKHIITMVQAGSEGAGTVIDILMKQVGRMVFPLRSLFIILSSP